MAIDRENATQKARDLSRSASSLVDALRRAESTDDQIAAEFEKVRDNYDELVAAVDQEGERVEFGSLMRSIGDSLVEAQRGLDRESKRYLGEVVRGSGGQDPTGEAAGLATVYRIPKLEADLKFALEKVKGNQVNLLLYRRSEEARELHQQSVKFEIAAVPPTPETLRLIFGKMPRLELVLAPAERAEIFAALDATSQTESTMPARAHVDVLKADAARVILLRESSGSSQEPPDVVVYVIYAQTAEAGELRLGAWLLSLPATGQPSAQSVRPFRVLGEGLTTLHEKIMAFADSQKAFFDSLEMDRG